MEACGNSALPYFLHNLEAEGVSSSHYTYCTVAVTVLACVKVFDAEGCLAPSWFRRKQILLDYVKDFPTLIYYVLKYMQRNWYQLL
jgi:hypothetical protein